MIRRPAAAGMLDRQPNEPNRREILISLPKEGRRVEDEVTERRRGEIVRIVDAMPTARHGGLVKAPHAFSEAGDDPLAQRHGEQDVYW
ncbi:hypothetical protein [Streptomyces sp. NBC_01497]|uniref:hypothetical protein n=1 Tax=Streptomyces sp. NBC_01497 TaxID=2903885 RepID=UPI002E364C0F|nr:hypothetical protein [Streptomyces sp. NBC_01497]